MTVDGMYPLLHSPATYGRPRLLVVADDDLSAFGPVIADADRHGLRTFVLCLTRGLPLPGSGATHAVLSSERERELRAAGAPLGAFRLDVVGYCAPRHLADVVTAHVDRVRPDAAVTRTDAVLPAIRAAAHRPAASYLLTRAGLTDPDGRPVDAPWTTRPTRYPKEAS